MLWGHHERAETEQSGDSFPAPLGCSYSSWSSYECKLHVEDVILIQNLPPYLDILWIPYPLPSPLPSFK